MQQGNASTTARAPGKVILLGEHAVVYGRPAIAVPVVEVRAAATVSDAVSSGVTIHAPDIGRTIDVASALSAGEPLSVTVQNTLAHLDTGVEAVALVLTIRSTIPVASGLGSGAAVATAIVRALSEHLGSALDAAVISSIVYETERIHHGTPSGVDNTVVAFERPVTFCRGHPIEVMDVPQPFWLAIADTGVPSLTKETVGDVRAAWMRDRAAYERLFDRVGALVLAARAAIAGGQVAALGPLMNKNQALLRTMGVSSPELEALVAAALGSGAHGAKLSGGGRGGNMIAAIDREDATQVRGALRDAGAKNVIVTEVRQHGCA